MGYDRSDGEEDIPSNDAIRRKKFKFPKKSLEDCSGVHITSVPRKIRSAFKKRCCTSISPNIPACKKLKWQTDSVEFHRKNGLMKSGLNLKRDKSIYSPKDDCSSLSLSKDEEEVAQALFALAGVIPNMDQTCNDENMKQTCNDEFDGEPSRDNYSNLPKTANSGSGNENFVAESEGDVPKVNLHLTSIMSEKISSRSNENSGVADIKFNHPSKSLSHEGNLPSCNYMETSKLQTGVACSLLKAESLVMDDNKNTGSTFWPVSTSRISCSVEGLDSVKPPTGSPQLKESKVVLHSNKSWKRCLTHVHISRYIRDSQAASGKMKRLPVNNRQKIGGGSNSRDPGNRLPGSGVGSSNGSASSPSHEKDAEEVRNAILLHKRLVQASTSSFGGHKQSLGHFCWASGYGCQSSNEAGRSKATTSDVFQFLQSQSQPAIHIPLFQNYYTSTTEPSSSAVAHQVLLPTYVGPTQIGLSPPLPLSSAAAASPQQEVQKKAIMGPPNRSGVNLVQVIGNNYAPIFLK